MYLILSVNHYTLVTNCAQSMPECELKIMAKSYAIKISIQYEIQPLENSETIIPNCYGKFFVV